MIPFQSIDICTKEQHKEAQLSLYVAVCTSIANVDHLSDLHKDTPFNVNLYRTKCTNIINNVIGPYFYKELVKDIGDGYYSLLINESTDITVNKMLGIAIRYYSITKENYIDLFKTDLYWRWHSGIYCKCNKKVINWRKIAVNQNARNWHWQCIDYGRDKFKHLRTIEKKCTSY